LHCDPGCPDEPLIVVAKDDIRAQEKAISIKVEHIFDKENFDS